MEMRERGKISQLHKNIINQWLCGNEMISSSPHPFTFASLTRLSQHQCTHNTIFIIIESAFTISSTHTPIDRQHYVQKILSMRENKIFHIFLSFSFLRKINKHKLWLHCSLFKLVLRGKFEWQRAVKKGAEIFLSSI